MAAARSILNDWNAGTIPYHTVPPKYHSSSIASAPRIPAGTVVVISDPGATGDVEMGEAGPGAGLLKSATDVGAAQYVSKFSAPFDLEGLFSASDRAVLDGEGGLDDQGVEVDELIDDGGKRAEGCVCTKQPFFKSDVTDESLFSRLVADDEGDVSLSVRPQLTKKRAHSPAPSLSTVHPSTSDMDFEATSSFGGTSIADSRRVKLPRPKRARYNPNAPVVLDAQESAAMADANPLSRKRLRDEAKRRKKGPGRDDEEGMTIDDGDVMSSVVPKQRSKKNEDFSFTASGGCFAILAEAEIPLPEDDDEEL
jgi:nuclear GTP-binding protein